METMNDLLEKVRALASQGFEKDAARRLFGWDVKDISIRTPVPDESAVLISFENGLILDAKYLLNPVLEDMGDTVEFSLGLKTDLVSRVRYNLFYSSYIHGQGYMRVAFGEVKEPMVQRALDDFYVHGLRAIFKPIILEFKGFFTRDYFGVFSNRSYGEVYYSSVSNRTESKEADVGEVIGRLHHLDGLIREQGIRSKLAELDLQMGLLPDVILSDL